jgi:hypothetical protein
VNGARDTWPQGEDFPRIPADVTAVPTSRTSNLNAQALVSIAIVIVWAAIVIAVTATSNGTSPSQFDYDNGAVPPSATGRQLNVTAGVVYVVSLPVALIALWTAVSSLRLWKEQVSSTIAVIVSGLASLVSLGTAAVGVGTFIFFT